MTPDLIRRALKRIDELKAELGELESFVQLYQRLAPKLDAEPQAEEKAAKIEETLNKPTPQREIHDMAREGLRSEGRPIPTNLLYEKLTSRGVIVGGQNPIGNLGAKLAYAPDLQNTRGEGWWFKPEESQGSLASNVAISSSTEDKEPPSGITARQPFEKGDA